ncbi:deoxyuridine 5'-triphosphate nucleotidohydrolase-like [Melopsittacus undulatus]|uniref:deoxyuridine 5'-triphosphate nucleotidohydrolase-like n=1 Tax=Melopsittacus undulatus TaxID=13146 RepID=UPI00146E5992|nr:deoxyuridine 5'-triphosphate nucleotidohydrolase-like [Melopsittacus undulatus]
MQGPRKWEIERLPSHSDKSAGCLDSLASATAGSARVDLATAVDITLLDTQVQLVDSALWGPLGRGVSALLIGHSSVSRRGIFVVPGLIDADFRGNIKIMVYTLCPPVTIPKGEKIAQLIPFEAKVSCQGEQKQGSGGFSSTGQPEVLLAKEISKRKPTEII